MRSGQPGWGITCYLMSFVAVVYPSMARRVCVVVNFSQLRMTLRMSSSLARYGVHFRRMLAMTAMTSTTTTDSTTPPPMMSRNTRE